MPIRTAFVCLIAVMTSGCAMFEMGATDHESFQVSVSGTDQAVQEFLTGRDLDPIEGAWQQNANALEIVISRNEFGIAADYDYVGIITRSNEPNWGNGDVKILLRKTNAENVYDGIWVTTFKSERQMTFVIETQNLVQANYVSPDGNTNFVRINRMTPRFARTGR